MNNKEGIKKIVLAYSGGLDTSIIIPWLKENYNNPEIIAVAGNVGQADELEGLEEKAIKTGASKLYVLDLKKDFVENYIFPCVLYACAIAFVFLIKMFIAMNGPIPHNIDPKRNHNKTVVPFSTKFNP